MSSRRHGRSPAESLLGVAATLQKQGSRRRTRAVLRALGRRNAESAEPVTGEAPVVVSLTTFGPLLSQVHLAVESIAAGTVRPARLILWVDDEDTAADPPDGLRRLTARGLEIRATADIGPYKKFYPALTELGPDQFLATADDDALYPRRWLQRMVAAGTSEPDLVHCYRARRIVLDADRLAPYQSWPLCYSRIPSHRHFSIGVSGVLHPPRMTRALRTAGDGFLTTAPRADDVWLNATAAANGIRVRQLGRIPVHFPLIPGSQSVSLFSANRLRNENDTQIVAAYSAAAVAAVRADRDR